MYRIKIKTAACLAVFSLMVLGARGAWANPANDSAALTLTVTPNVDYGVQIDSANAVGALALGTVDLGASTFTVLPCTMTILGTWGSQELDVAAAIHNNPAWVFDTSTVTTNSMVGWIIAKATTATTIALADFEAQSNAGRVPGAGASTVNTHAGGAAGAGTRFEFNAGADLDTLPVGAQRHLWFRLDLPGATTDATDVQVKYTFTATGSN